MLARALIVLLLVLNLGVAAWWTLRPATQVRAVEPDTGVAQLQLVTELPTRAPLPRARPLPAGPPAITSIPGTAAPDTRVVAVPGIATGAVEPPANDGPSTCFSFGPFAPNEVAAARARLQPLVQRSAVRTQVDGPVSAWRVYLPPLPNADAAKAMAQRIADAGFSDYLIMREGTDANAIALGNYGSEATAQRRVQALTAAGFPARARPVGGGKQSAWLDVATAAGFDAAAAQTRAAAPGRQPLDCARM